MNVAKLFAINILLGVAFILLVGCSDFKERVTAVQAICSTDTECIEFDPYFDVLGPQATAQEVLALKKLCESDPNDLLDLQECP